MNVFGWTITLRLETPFDDQAFTSFRTPTAPFAKNIYSYPRNCRRGRIFHRPESFWDANPLSSVPCLFSPTFCESRCAQSITRIGNVNEHTSTSVHFPHICVPTSPSPPESYTNLELSSSNLPDQVGAGSDGRTYRVRPCNARTHTYKYSITFYLNGWPLCTSRFASITSPLSTERTHCCIRGLNAGLHKIRSERGYSAGMCARVYAGSRPHLEGNCPIARETLHVWVCGTHQLLQMCTM